MRTHLVFFSLLLLPFSVQSQTGPGAQAAQIAQQATQQATQQAQRDLQQAMQNASEANRQAAQATQQASQNPPITTPCFPTWTAPPKFSVKAGKYPGPTQVTITDASRGAVIYYSTDGWTPTTNSPRYRGPIEIDSTTTLQAIAIAPYSRRSVVTSAQYTIAGTGPDTFLSVSNSTSNTGSPNAIAVPLLFGADVSSKTATVGDKIPMTLTQDLNLNGYIVKKGTSATATVTQVDRTGIGGAPGSVSFEADDLRPDSGPIPLQGGATRDGQAKIPGPEFLIPVAGELSILKHGTDAVIPKGTLFVAYIDLGTPTANAQ
ncbi:MAG TPA: chitobiase/beta-hexosaminidase C-terminal domain-containing protein [Candidatus Acidoferrum sp.]|nr:chitobiase/beta-hexosaminidase C-terminal domain-containing protein [Candidatus Acidoferrum sp.]